MGQPTDDENSEWVDSSDEECEIIEEPIICCDCMEELSPNEEILRFDNGAIFCMECADLLEHEVEIYTDDEE